jgi:calcineurin-like phosphoesterase family protein
MIRQEKPYYPTGVLKDFSRAKTWFTADTHFGHRRISTLASRPFASVEEMDRVLIENWNRRVAPNDVVFHLGDFAFKNAKGFEKYREQLNGRIYFIWGNHDSEEMYESPCWEASAPLMQIEVERKPIVLCHYGMRIWNLSHHGAYHFYGHSHGRLPGDSLSCDVGVDNPAFGYAPALLDEIEAHLSTLKVRPRFGEEIGSA